MITPGILLTVSIVCSCTELQIFKQCSDRSSIIACKTEQVRNMVWEEIKAARFENNDMSLHRAVSRKKFVLLLVRD